MLKKVFVIYIICSQPIMPIMLAIEHIARGYGVPIVFGAIIIIDVICIWNLKDVSGGKLFSKDRMSRFGFIYYWTFDVLKGLEKNHNTGS